MHPAVGFKWSRIGLEFAKEDIDDGFDVAEANQAARKYSPANGGNADAQDDSQDDNNKTGSSAGQSKLGMARVNDATNASNNDKGKSESESNVGDSKGISEGEDDDFGI